MGNFEYIDREHIAVTDDNADDVQDWAMVTLPGIGTVPMRHAQLERLFAGDPAYLPENW